MIKQRKNISKLIIEKLTDQFGGDIQSLNNALVSFLVDRMIIHEDQNNQLTDNDFSVDLHISKLVKIIVSIFLDDKKPDYEIENQLKKAFANFINELHSNLTNAYSSKKIGAEFYLSRNLKNLISEIVGQNTEQQICSFDEKYSQNFIDAAISYNNSNIQENNNSNDDNGLHIVNIFIIFFRIFPYKE